MDARLPLSANLGFYRKRAKELKRAVTAGEQSAIARLVKRHPRYRGGPPSAKQLQEVSLGDAQLVIAREHGFATWNEFKVAVASVVPGSEPSDADRLMAAICAGEHADVAALLEERPALASTADGNGVLPLVAACDRGATAVVKLLLDAGADPNAGDPLFAAAHAGPHKPRPALDVVALLLERGARNDIFTKAALGLAGELGRELPGIDIDARGPRGASALYLAAANGHVDAVRVLLEAGADPNSVSAQGRSVFRHVFLHIWGAPYREIARLLLDHGVSCSFREACDVSHLPTVKKLLATDPEAKDEPNAAGVTPLLAAVLNADVELARLLLDAGAADPKGRGRALVDAVPQRGQRFAGALFGNCSFQRANFHDCSLKDAVFSDIDLSGCHFANVNLAGVTIDSAFIDGLTIWGIEVGPLLEQERARRARTEPKP